MNLKNVLGQIEANGGDIRQIGDRLSPWTALLQMGCSTTTILAQLLSEQDAGAGAVHTITVIPVIQEPQECAGLFSSSRLS